MKSFDHNKAREMFSEHLPDYEINGAVELAFHDPDFLMAITKLVREKGKSSAGLGTEMRKALQAWGAKNEYHFL
ncbi:hypothetical protein KKC60_02150 [Patescibacteria group bacterium]|nr:hypothetical protein [Patescibacteria group bacterium]